MQERLNVTIVVDIKTPEGNDWHRSTLEYADMPYEMVVQLENEMIEGLRRLNLIAAEEIEKMKSKHPKV